MGSCATSGIACHGPKFGTTLSREGARKSLRDGRGVKLENIKDWFYLLGVLNPICLVDRVGGSMSCLIAWKTTRNRRSYFRSRVASFWARSLCVVSNCRSDQLMVDSGIMFNV